MKTRWFLAGMALLALAGCDDESKNDQGVPADMTAVVHDMAGARDMSTPPDAAGAGDGAVGDGGLLGDGGIATDAGGGAGG